MYLRIYLFIGLTPFLYLHNTVGKPYLQDGKFTRKVAAKSCNREKTELSGIFLLTAICSCDMINVLGRSDGLPHFALLRRELL